MKSLNPLSTLNPIADSDVCLTYDGSFEGLLTCIFYQHQQHLLNAEIWPNDEPQMNMLLRLIPVETNMAHAERIFSFIKKILGKEGVNLLLTAFLAEARQKEQVIAEVIKMLVKKPDAHLLQNYASPAVLALHQWQRQVAKEQHRMLAFVRFERMNNDVYFARIEPDFNVLPLISDHFKKRYADQQWLIYDVKRSYGLYFDLKQVQPITQIDMNALNAPQDFFHEQEKGFQQLWQSYFEHINIKERANPKLHRQWLPVRYWKYLTEKHPH